MGGFKEYRGEEMVTSQIVFYERNALVTGIFLAIDIMKESTIGLA